MKILIAVIVTAAILIAVVAAGTGGTGGQQTRTDAQIIELKHSIALDKDAMAEATRQMDF